MQRNCSRKFNEYIGYDSRNRWYFSSFSDGAWVLDASQKISKKSDSRSFSVATTINIILTNIWFSYKYIVIPIQI